MDTIDSLHNLKFNPFLTDNNLLLNNLIDPGVNLFKEKNFQNLDTSNLTDESIKTKPKYIFLFYI